MKTRFARLILLLLLLATTVLIALVELSKRFYRPSRVACVNYILQIDGAKQQWALEMKKPSGYVPSPADELEICTYIMGGVRPTCPEGGRYSFNPIDTMPTCSLKDDPERGRAHTFDPKWLPAATAAPER